MDNNIAIFILFYVSETLIYTALYVAMVKDFIENVNRDIVDALIVMFCGCVLLLLWVFIVFGISAIIVTVS